MQIQVCSEPRWDVPAGSYHATLERIVAVFPDRSNPGQEWVRLCFKVHHPHFTKREYVAARNYPQCLQTDCELRHVVRCLKGGADLTDEEIDGGNVELDAYIGRQVDLELVHIKNSGYPKPYVHIRGIYPLGTLVKDPVAAPTPQPVNANQIYGGMN